MAELSGLAADQEWLRLQDGTYKIYRDGWFPAFTVCAPGGSVIACAFTMWGARRKIRKHRADPPLNFWQGPIVHSEPGEADHG